MSAALANRIFEVLGDQVALDMVRQLQREPLTQADLVRSTGHAQSGVWRAANNLRLMGMTAAESTRGKISLRAPDGVAQLLAAANGLAMDLLAREAVDQAALSTDGASLPTLADSERLDDPR